ncbi:MAG: gamma-glutamyltransferase family protein [Burkholderiaceae bacterium]|jgi:gamma-glutamyltranspeptidase/glutathione hydrolase
MDFDWNNPYPTVRTPVFARNLVSTSHPLASQAGVRMLLKGGSAVDAAVAAAAVLTIVEPVSNGLGSDCFAIVADQDGLSGLNASGHSPRTWNADYFRKKYGETPPQRGWDSVTVPGAVAGWVALSQRYGKLAFADLLEPAIEIAERGHAVAAIVARKWQAQIETLAGQPGFAAAFMPHGRAPRPGEKFVFPEAGKTLRSIALTRGRSFYEGEIAKALAEHSLDNGGSMAEADLADFRPEWVKPIEKDYAGYTVHEIPPNGQGIAALMALGILSHLHIEDHPLDSVESQHLQIEAMKLAFADVYHWVADASAMTEVTGAHLLDDAYLAERARQINPDRAQSFGHGRPPAGGTVYLTAADERGMMISFIQSNYMGFGSGIVVPGTGVSLQNRGYGFSHAAEHPNRVAPRKRPFHTIIPAFLTRKGRPQMSFGVMGGNMQPQGHLQTLVRMLNYRQQPQAACDAPRWKFNRGLSLDCEATMPVAVVEALRARGHVIETIPDSYMDFGSGQFIWKLSEDPDHGYVAASDSRRDGQAAGF